MALSFMNNKLVTLMIIFSNIRKRGDKGNQQQLAIKIWYSWHRFFPGRVSKCLFNLQH